MQQIFNEGLAGIFYPRNLFRALLRQWKLEQRITSKHPSYPSGTLTGTATFHPRIPTDKQYSAEYLFTEEGDFHTDTGINMRVSRRYVWRVKMGKDGEVDKVLQWFGKVSGEEKNVGVDYLFHELILYILMHGFIFLTRGCPRCCLPTNSTADDEEG